MFTLQELQQIDRIIAQGEFKIKGTEAEIIVRMRQRIADEAHRLESQEMAASVMRDRIEGNQEIPEAQPDQSVER
jgi:hypothetical protein